MKSIACPLALAACLVTACSSPDPTTATTGPEDDPTVSSSQNRGGGMDAGRTSNRSKPMTASADDPEPQAGGDVGASGPSQPDASASDVESNDANASSPQMTCTSKIPKGKSCAKVGCNLIPMTVGSCENDGETIDFYDQNFCTAKMTVLTLFAEWCEPCHEEAKQLQAEIMEPYGDKGVRVINLMMENSPSGKPPTVDHCKKWSQRFNLTSQMAIYLKENDEHDIESLIDGYPTAYLIDNDGKIIAIDDIKKFKREIQRRLTAM